MACGNTRSAVLGAALVLVPTLGLPTLGLPARDRQLTPPGEGKTPAAAERFSDWTRPLFPAAEYKARREAALAALGENDVLLVPSAEGTSAGETFRQANDFEYFVGLEVVRSVLWLDGRTRQATLFGPANDPRFENPGRPNDFPGRPAANDPSLARLSGLDAFHESAALGPQLEALQSRGGRVMINTGAARPGAPAAASAMFETRTPGAIFAAFLHAEYRRLRVETAHTLVARLRMVKSDREVAIMRRAAAATVEAIVRGAGRVKPGVDERTLTGGFIADCLALGGERVPFTPIIKSGANSLWPWRILGAHYDRRNRVMQAGEMVIYDVGCEVDHYVSDVGRTFPVSDHFEPAQRELVEMVREISDRVIAAARPGITLPALQKVAEAAIPRAARPYMQAPLYFGHHLGLDSGDPFLADAPLAPGMIFTIEPWYYNHVEGIAVFIEDEILITPKGSENLTAALPRDAAGLERLRQARPH